MNYPQQKRPFKLNLDKSSKYHDDYECFFLLNSEGGGSGGSSHKKGSLGNTTPLAANYPACEMEMPSGENYSIGEYYSPITNELYSWVYNDNSVHFVQRINNEGECQVVYYGCLSLSAEPRHSIKPWRAYLKVEKEICTNRHGKYLVWVDGNEEDIFYLDVEASIATNNFTTQYFSKCSSPCELIKMCVPDPCDCLKGEFVPLPESERSLSNKILDAGFKFAYRHIYYDGQRASVWSDPSALFYINTKGCFTNSSGFSRCIKLRVPIGNPMVTGIEIAYQKDGGAWRSYELIEKYKEYTSAQQYWYERELSEVVTGNNYSDDDCSFDYYFCNDKDCEKIDDAEIGRVSNFMPRKPQGVFPINDALAAYNYEQGNCKIDRFEVDKFKINPIYPESTCENENCEITVRAIIHNRAHDRNQFIYRTGGSDDAPDDPTDTAWFGGLNPALDGGHEIGYDQSFREKTRNFIVYIDGTDYWAEMKQWKSHAYFNNRTDWGVVSNLDTASERNRWRRAIRNGEFFYQEIKLKVPKGTRGFLRLASHKATGNEQDTSTFVINTINDIRAYYGTASYSAMSKSGNEEIYFDTCNKNTLELFEAFIIDDNAVDTGLANKASAYHGYITDNNSLPVEGAIVEYSGVQYKTDHNGFYHFYINPGENDPISVDLKVEQDCFNFTTIETMSIQSGAGFNTRFDQKITDVTYTNGFYAKVNVPVVDCDGNPVSGIVVSISGSKSKATGADGIAKLRIRNYIERNRTVRVVVMNNNGCLSYDCIGGCNNCMPTQSSATTNCYMSIPVVSMSSKTINTVTANDVRGLKAGATYPFGFVVKGACGKLSAVNETGYVSIKRTQEKGKQSFPYFEYDATGISLPAWGDCLMIVRGENTTSFNLQWVVDKIERTTDGKLKITIQSLNDYNEKYLFKTNTVYKWRKGDRIEFIKNGDGTIFSSVINGVLNYLTISPFNTSTDDTLAADFFNQLVIEDDGRLSSLTEGAVIDILSDKECVNTNERPYFSICASIPIVNGKLLYETGRFDTFDTYFVNRTIGTFPSQQFEHPNPSDFWGDSLVRVNDAGRAYFVNKYESERRYGRNISINAPEQPNFFGDYVKTLDCPEQGDIVSMGITDNSAIIAICERDNFLAQSSNDLLKIGSDGIVRAKSPDEVISDAQPKLAGKYGCRYDDIGSIYYGDGYVSWVDGNSHCHVKHDYKMAVPVDEGKVNTFFEKRTIDMQAHNLRQTNPLNKIRFCTGYNSQMGWVYITTKSLRDGAVNNEFSVFAKPNDTIMYNPFTDDYGGFASFTPEGYGRMDLSNDNGCAFIAFFNGIPYIHPLVADKWNEFFGIAVDRAVGVTLNKFPQKTKNGLAIEVHDETMWFVKNITTEKANFKSEIPPKRWARRKNHWNAAFLYNINARGGLYGNHPTFAGEPTTGEFIDVLFVRDNTDDLKYNTIDNNKRIQYDELDSIFFKFSLNEQSGFTENV